MIVIIPLVILVAVIAWVLRPGKAPPRPRMLAVLAGLIPSLAVALAAIIFQLVYKASGNTGVSEISNYCFIVNLGLVAAGILASIGLAAARQGDIARGLGFGTCLAFILCIGELAILEWSGGV